MVNCQNCQWLMPSNGRRLIENEELKIENDMWGRREFNEESKMKNEEL